MITRPLPGMFVIQQLEGAKGRESNGNHLNQSFQSMPAEQGLAAFSYSRDAHVGSALERRMVRGHESAVERSVRIESAF